MSATGQSAVVHDGSGGVAVERVDLPRLEFPTHPGGRPRRCEHGAILRTLATGICGSDLHTLRDPVTPHGRVLGHEMVGEVVEVGRDVETVAVGDVCVVPFNVACGRCANCGRGLTSHCLSVNPERPGATYGMGMGGWTGLQAEYGMVPYADFNLCVLDDPDRARERTRDLVMLADVLPTGYHATLSAGVAVGSTVYVAGAGPVGLAAALAARLLGAATVLVGDPSPDRRENARSAGFLPVPVGDAPLAELVGDQVGSPLVDVGIDCVGMLPGPDDIAATAFTTLVDIVRPGGAVNVTGVYPGTPRRELPAWLGGVWSRALTVTTGATPAQRYQKRLAHLVMGDEGRVADVLDTVTVGFMNAETAYRDFGSGSSHKYVLVPEGHAGEP